MEEFLPTFPCFTQLLNDCITPLTVLSAGVPPVPALVILTDDDLREKFAAEHELYGPAIRFADPLELAYYLDKMKTAVPAIAFDPAKGKLATFALAEPFIARLLRLHKDG